MIQPAASGSDVARQPTQFLPAERAQPEVVERQQSMLAGLPFVREFLDAMPNMAVVLNSERQIVLANKAFAEYISGQGLAPSVAEQRGETVDTLISSVLGRRTGEAFQCVHARESDGGCGTTSFCRNCGAARAVVNSQHWQSLDVQECRLTCGEAGVRETALDFRIWAQPIDISGERFTVFSMLDISHEKRREALERIFFHDVMNTASGVKGLADLMARSRLPESAIREAAGMMSESADQLIDEISAQRSLSLAETGDLVVAACEVQSLEIIDRVIRQFHSYCVSRGKSVQIDDATEPFAFASDPVLLRRVLGNMVKNALEAESVGGIITICARAEGDHALFTVHNARVIPKVVQMQIFQRSFSTKGTGRGLGTYSIKLLSERYLAGSAWFTSNDATGTTFSVRYPLRPSPAPAA